MLVAVEQPDLFYARQQMAFSLGTHIVIACIGMAFPFMVVIAEWRAQRTGDRTYDVLARRWAKALGVLFAVGAVSGTILSFEFGILWPGWMAKFGDVMGLPFAMEGFAFFLEAIFVGIYLYGWDRLPPRVHLLTGIPIGIAGVCSAFFVVAANGWMNTPTGFDIDASGAVTNVDPWAAFFNTALWPEATHMILAAFIVAGCLVAMPYAWALLHGKNDRYHRLGLTIPFVIAMVAVPVQLVVGDWAARHVAEQQPVKLAALEGVYETEDGAALYLGGFYDDGGIRFGIRIPKLLSTLAFHDPDATVAGLEEVPPSDRPPVNMVRTAFQLMVMIGFALLGLGAWCAWSWRRKGALPIASRWFLRTAVMAGPASVIALEAGWIVTEVGRQPWIVYEVMRVRDAVTDSPNIRYGYFLLVAVYVVLAVATYVVLRRLARVPLPVESSGDEA
ncbi:MAG: cytochrome ubiquinol oxidase subunit I [Actinomycetota bacterium]